MRHQYLGENEKPAIVGDSAEVGLLLLLRPPDKTVPNTNFEGCSAPGKGSYRMVSTESKIL
jgi:hypothetical protein